MTGRASAAEALAETLAYVDNCLAPAARRAFEARLGADAELRRNVARWQAQNRDIRCAFGAPAREALDLGRATNENSLRRLSEPARRADGGPRPLARRAPCRRRPCRPRIGAGRRPIAPPGRSSGSRPWRRFGCSPPRPASVRSRPLRCSALALPQRALCPRCRSSSRPATILASLSVWDRAWRRRRRPRPGCGCSARASRPGAEAAAALYVYEDARGERAALMVEPLDEIAPAPPRRGESGGFSAVAWTGAGYGFVAAAAEPDDVDALSEVAAAER